MVPELSVVIPMYNEEEVLPLLVGRLRPLLDGIDATYEVIAVDDGSSDLTPALLQRFRREWPSLRVVRLRANAGHQAAISAGLVSARGDYVVTLDADLQDPPEVIPHMLELARRDGVDVVYGVRSDRSTDTWFKRVSARTFYALIGAVSKTSAHADAGDFRLMSRATVDAINGLPDHNRVLRFIVPALGFPSDTVEYKREERAAGASKYPLLRMLKLSVDSLTGFSAAPLRVATFAGIGGALIAALFVIYALVTSARGRTVPGWTSTVAIVAGFSAIQLLCVGILGEYIGRMYAHLQGRPTYFIAYDSLTGPQRPGGPTDTALPAASSQRVASAQADRPSTSPRPPVSPPSSGEDGQGRVSPPSESHPPGSASKRSAAVSRGAGPGRAG
ncbi:MAG: glycosyltransferase family 2 protein [Intrasporangium sp.]|uniref:glycosyltransferase family 2 protein n=1 Tax=Intrasporangium sp. TaxID=1925024 RepID=UPI0026491B09|nr:glycosyltransferase family 2 protein [Intrasporangium sp.]MDN5797519.1 glycosyltransferase family 2 protein [Intrasporangium sp.]